MKCEQAEILMAELLAGEIRPDGRAALEAHLVECPACRADFQEARAGFRVEWPETAPSARLVEATRALFREPSALLRFLRFGTAAAASFAAALLILLSGGGRGKEAPPAAAPPPMRLASSRVERLASIQEAVVGSLVAKDEEGRPAGELGLRSHTVSVEILDGVAKTTVEENFQNHTDRRLEGTFRFPLPPDASISRLALEVNGKIEEGTCLEREKAREVFESIVRRMKDPALLEWMPGGIFQCRIFPIEPRATKRVIVAYTQALPYFRGTMTYVYPLASEKTKAHPPEELRIDVDVKLSGELKRIESPSHKLDLQRARPNEARASFRARNLRPENDFVLTMETADDELRVIPHKVDGDDGYFALSLTPRGAGERRPGRYAFVLDVSASVTGPELEVARRVVRAMMENRTQGDRFEVIAHHIEVERSGEVDLRQANDFMDRLSPVGGCDLVKGLLAAPAEAEIVYVGSGTPTYGETETAKILEALKGRRVRSVAVGSRANLALFEKLGATARIGPNDAVGRRCLEIAATLGSPALADIKVEGGDALYDVVGVHEIHYGERLLVTGRYRGPAAMLVVTASGGYRRELAVAFPAKEEGNNYVRRLWAQRKIADLLALADKKQEITALGVKHQIMTPYTSFLVLESEQMWKDHQLQREVQKEDKVLAKAGSLEEFAGKRMDEALTKSLAEVASEGEALTRLIGGRTDADAKKALETIEKFKQIAVSQNAGRQKALPAPDPAKVAEKIKENEGVVGSILSDVSEERMKNPEEPKKKLVIVDNSKTREEVIRREGPATEDPRARAIREAYQEQVKRERPVTGIKGEGQFESRHIYDRDLNQMREYNAALERDNAETRPKADGYDQLRRKMDGVPQMRNIPVLGHLFGGKERGPLHVDYEQETDDPAGFAIPSFAVDHETLRNQLEARGLVVGDEGGLYYSPAARDNEWDGYTAFPTVGGSYHGRGFTNAHGHFQYEFDMHQSVVDPRDIDSRRGIEGQVDVQPDPTTNSLVIHRNPKTFRSVGDRAGSQGYGDEHVDNYPSGVNGGDYFYRRAYGTNRVPPPPPVTVPGALVTDAMPVTVERTVNPAAAPYTPNDTTLVFRSKGDRTDEALKEMDTRVLKLKHTKVPEPYTAKVEPGKFINGTPTGTSAEREKLVERFELKKLLEAQLSRDAGGRVLGKLEFDPQTNVFVVRDTREVQERIGRIVEAYDVEGGWVAPRADGLGHLSTEVLEADGRTLTLKLGLRPGTLMAITRDRTFVAIVLITETVEGRSRGLVWRGIAVDSIRAGDQAQVIAEPAVYVAQLPAEAKKILASRRSQEEMRGKMGW